MSTEQVSNTSDDTIVSSIDTRSIENGRSIENQRSIEIQQSIT